jgi:hypothetical protein
LARNFHPAQDDGSAATRWLEAHSAVAPPANPARAIAVIAQPVGPGTAG